MGVGKSPVLACNPLWGEHQTVHRTGSPQCKAFSGHQHSKYLPYAFTEHGAIMAGTILNSPQAVEMTVYVVRAFVQLRELLVSNKELARRFAQHLHQTIT